MPALSAIQAQLKEHEEWLISLRQDPCMTLAKIRTELDNHKGIKAAPHQLETYFRNLGQRKNLSRRDWIAVFRALDSQKTFGRRYRLFLSGKEIEERELQKKRKNAKPAQPLVETLVDADRLLTQLPDGVTVERRPPPGSSRSQQHSITPQSMSHASSDVNPNSEARTLLDNILASNDPVAGPSSIRHDTGPASNSIGSRLASTASASQSSLQIGPVDIAAHLLFEPRYNFGHFEMYNGITPSIPASGGGNISNGQLSPGAFLPSLQSPDLVSQNDYSLAGFNYVSPMNITLDDHTHNLSPIEFARLPVWDIDSTILPHGWHGSNAPFPAAKDVFEGLHSLVLIDDADGDFSGLFDVFNGPGMFTDQFIQLLLFSIVNNFAGLDGTPAKVIIEFIHRHEPLRSRILHHITTGVSIISSRAMVEKLLEAAIEAGESKTVHDLLVLDMVRPDDIVFFETSRYKIERRLTAVEKASKLRHFHIVGDLLRFGADVNKSHEKDGMYRIEKGALEYAIGVWGEYHPIDINTVELLLSNGATVSGRLMSAAICWGDGALVEKLMSTFSPSEHVHHFDEVIFDASEYLTNDLGLKFVRQVMQACREMHNNECIDSNPYCLAKAMCKAARRNNHDLVDLMLPHGGQQGLDMALTGAARFGSHTLVRWLLEHGARANGQACRLDHDPFDTTALAEAIRRGDDELVALFAKEGAWHQIGEPEVLQATMRAVGESGSQTYLLQVLDLVPNPGSRALSFALYSAIKACHEELALKLLNAVAAPDPVETSGGSTQAPLIEALKIKSQAITWAILESGIPISQQLNQTVLEAAVVWGDLEIIKALFFMHMHDDVSASRAPALSLAIKAGNRSVIDLMIKLGAAHSINPSRNGIFHGVDLPWEYWSPLSAAALVRDAVTADYLLDQGANPADETAILNAIAHDRLLLHHILQRFRQRYPQGITGFGGRVLIYVLKTHDETALDMCLRACFDVNSMVWEGEYKQTALAVAVKNHHSGLAWITKLLDAGGDVNLLASVKQEPLVVDGRVQAFPSRQTVLLDAIETRNLPLVELLISRGANVQKEAKLGLRHTPLQKACEVGSHTIVDLLLKHNADVNEAPASRCGATALQLAAKVGSLRIAQKLVDLGANLDAPGARFGGRSAIEYAAEHGRLHMILFLCNAVDGNLPADQYKSAIALAQGKGHRACADILTELSAKNQAVIDASGR